MKKYLVIHMVKNSQGIATNKVCGVFNLPQDAEAYKDKYDRRMLDSYMITATLELDEKGRFVPQSFEYNEDEPTNEETLLRIYGIEDYPLDEAFKDLPGENKVVTNPEELGNKNPFKENVDKVINEAVEKIIKMTEYKNPGDFDSSYVPSKSEEELLKEDPNGIQDEMAELK